MPLISGMPDDETGRPPEIEPPSSTWSRPVRTLLGLLVAYYAFPVELSETAPVSRRR